MFGLFVSWVLDDFWWVFRFLREGVSGYEDGFLIGILAA